MSEVLRFRELEPWRPEPLSDVQARILRDSGVVEVRPGLVRGWEVKPAGRVGAARVGDLEVQITPKVPIARLMFLLGYLADPKAWHDQPVSFDAAPDLASAAAEALSRQLDMALRRGVLQGYVSIEEALPTIRGRIREADQLRRRYGAVLPVEIRYDDYTVDIAENRILRTAADRMLAVGGISDTARHRLARVRHRLAEVTPLVRGTALPVWRPSRLNARYVPALRLAQLVLAATSWDMGTGAVPVTGFLVNMATLFENFVCTALGEAIRGLGGVPSMQDRSRTLDIDRQIDLRPDLVWYDQNRRSVAVVDAKYKAEKYDGFPNADIYQALAYCTAFGLPRGHLVYARGNEEPRTYTIQHGRSAGRRALPGPRGPASRLAGAGPSARPRDWRPSRTFAASRRGPLSDWLTARPLG